MSRDATLYVEDILEAAKDVTEFVGDLNRDQFLQDKKTIAATSRCFEIIGEGVKNYPKIGKPKNRRFLGGPSPVFATCSPMDISK